MIKIPRKNVAIVLIFLLLFIAGTFQCFSTSNTFAGQVLVGNDASKGKISNIFSANNNSDLNSMENKAQINQSLQILKTEEQQLKDVKTIITNDLSKIDSTSQLKHEKLESFIKEINSDINIREIKIEELNDSLKSEK